MIGAARAIAAAAVGLVALGCVSRVQLEHDLSSLQQRVRAAYARAVVCAPRELAEADVEIAYAARLADRGLGVEAAARLSRAEGLVVAAVERSRPAHCERDRDDDGLLDSQDACPDQPESVNGVEDEDGCPEMEEPDLTAPAPPPPPAPADRDADGVLDAADACPDVPGSPANRGCPADRDGDGVADASDGCPDEPGPVASGGCPYRLVSVKDNRIHLKRKIFFRSGKADIDPQSFEVLDELTSLLERQQGLKIRIEGHTDDRGNDKRNRLLSKRRAEAVRLYLVKRGIDPYRLVAAGLGEDRPLADNDTPEGRELNRRVEFHVIEGGGPRP